MLPRLPRHCNENLKVKLSKFKAEPRRLKSTNNQSKGHATYQPFESESSYLLTNTLLHFYERRGLMSAPDLGSLFIYPTFFSGADTILFLVYHMPKSAASDVQSTPSSHINADVGLSDRAKQRVRDAAGNSRCLVENCVEVKAVQFCHCYPRKMSYKVNERRLDTIEWYWNMQHRTLNLDTRVNIFRAGASLHYLFDQHHWFFLPEEHIVDRYYKSLTVEEGEGADPVIQANRNSFPTVEGPRFKYRFIPISLEMSEIPLIRQNNSKSLRKDDTAIYLHPFSDMPSLESHLHPKFAILDAGLKLRTKRGQIESLSKMIQNRTILGKITRIYAAWTSDLPIGHENDKTFNSKEDPDGESHPGDDQSDRTAFRRVLDPTTRKRVRPNESPTSAHQGGRGQKTFESASSICLTKKSIKLHDQRSGNKKWTDDALHDWSKQCYPPSETVYAPWNPTEICI